jgi:5'-methylthioadenosine phosphorylase
MEALEQVHKLAVETPFGRPSDDIVVGTIDGTALAFVTRHGQGHRHMPTQVPYRANIFALKQLGVERIVSVSACGSLRESLHPGEIVVPDQLVDMTKFRANTFFGDGLVAHVAVADPFCPCLSGLVADAVESVDGTVVHRGGKLVTIEGPRFSTKAESEIFRLWGMDTINMTTCPEAFLAREAEMCYAVMNTISDYDVWHESEEPVTVEMVIEILERNARLAQQAVRRIVAGLDQLDEESCECRRALGQALITAPDEVSPSSTERLGPLLHKYYD